MHDNLTSKQLESLRAEIDRVDDAILTLLAERLTISRRICEEKHRRALPINQPQRYRRSVARWQELATAKGLCPDFAADVYELLHGESSRIQRQPD